jgi:hypothetical protein
VRPTSCPSGKWWFLDQREADRSAQEDERKYGYRMRAYKCPDCGWWHKAKALHDGIPIILLDELGQ